MNSILVVFRKEIMESLRDRKATFNSLLLGPLLFPVLFLGIAWFGISMQQERAEKPLRIPMVGAEHAPNLVAWLEEQGVEKLPPVDDPEDMVRRNDAEAIIRIQADFAKDWQAGRPAPIEIIADPSRRETTIAINRIRGLIQAYSGQIGSLRVQLRGVSPDLARPIQIINVDLSTPKSRGMMVMIFLPYVLMLTAFTGGLHLAMDSTAGEKERRSLEPLFLNPVPRWRIMCGKLLATMAFGFLSLLLTLLSFRLALPFLPIDQLGIDLKISTHSFLTILLVIAPVTLLAAALLTLLASFARSYKEAQSYMALVILIPVIPSMLFMTNPVKPEADMMWIPLFSQNLLISEIVRGEAVPAVWLLASAGGTLALGLALACVAANLYNRAKLIYSGA
jgi:sodium transport system permease protein